MKRRRTRALVLFYLPIDVDQGQSGLFYVTSPLVKGLLVADTNEREAVRKVQDALKELAKAAMAETPVAGGLEPR